MNSPWPKLFDRSEAHRRALTPAFWRPDLFPRAGAEQKMGHVDLGRTVGSIPATGAEVFRDAWLSAISGMARAFEKGLGHRRDWDPQEIRRRALESFTP